jgi:thermitase
MKKKIVGTFMLALLLTSMLGFTSIMRSFSAYETGSNRFSENSAVKVNETNSADKITYSSAGKSKGSNASSEIMSRWNFNGTNEWKNFTYANGDKTRLIVGLDGESFEDILKLKEIAAKYKSQIVNTVSFGGIVKAAVVEISFEYVTSFVQEVKAMELASYVEPNMRVQVQWVPNDPYWTYQWGPKKIMADWAWNTTIGSSAVLVAVVDTGIYYYHEDLAINYAPLGRDWVNMDEDPLDDNGHGTHCAGIIAAAINNSIGIAGLAQVRIMAEKVLDSGGYGYADWVANGIIHAADSGAKIISMSLGGYGYSELLHEAVKYAYDHGVLIIAAAGNDNTNMKLYPAGYDEVIAVAATDQYDKKAWFSNWGDWIELAAPGVDIYSTVPWGYQSWSGTSMATPHVSGVAALVWSLHPNKTRDWVRLWLRYTADDLGDPGFDVYYGYGRINARKAVEQTPPVHELIAYEWATPPFVKPEAIGTINATVLNFGESNETDVTVQLLANSTVVGSASIEFLESGDTATVSFAWNPMVEGLYNVTLYVVPVPGETGLENNVLWKYIYVGFPVKAVVLHSAGNVYSEIITNWQVLSSEWHLFGDTMVYVDYTTLNKKDLTYEDIANTEADVLIISCAYDPYAGWEFTDSEIEAIKQYVYEGHGLIVTAGTFYYMVPNNNKLAPLLGLNENVMWTATGTDLLHLINTTHPLFNKVPNPLVFPQVGTALPYDRRWDQNELVDGRYLALGHYQESAIVVCRGLVYISPWLEVIPAYYHHHLQLLYNAILWSRYQKPQHELIVSLEAPKSLKPGRLAILNATVYNMGLNNETDVQLQLLINSEVVNSTVVSELYSGGYYTISYLWTPTDEGIYNVTAYAPPVPGEENLINNVKSEKVLVSALLVAIFQNYDPWEYPANQESLNRYGVPYVLFRSSDFGKVDLSVFTKVVIASDQDQAFYNSMDTYRWWFENYVSNGGVLEIHAADMGWHGGRWIGFLPGGLQWTSYYGECVTVVNWAHPLLNTPNMITEAELDNWNCAVHGYFSAYPADANIIIIEDYTRMPVYLEFSYGSGFIIASSQTLEWAYKRRFSLILENSLLYMPKKYEHDLAVSLDAPAFMELGNSIVLNATVRNRGLSNETDVELYLLINGTVVSSVMIPELLVGESYTINYVWAPTSTGSYNVTAYAPPVFEEENTANNIVVKRAHVFFYTRLYIPHEWVGAGNPMGWHADDACWQYTLPFDFPFYGVNYRTIYISSNGLITFLGPDVNRSNSIPDLAGKLAIAPAWDDWVTYAPYDIYIWQNSTHVGIRWYVRAYGSTTVANFEAILCINGTIQFNYNYNDGPVSATIGISNGSGHILAENAANLNFIHTIVFLPFQLPKHDVAVINVTPSANEVRAGDTLDINVVVKNEGEAAENFTVTVYAAFQGNTSSTTLHSSLITSARIYLDPSNYIFNTDTVSVGYKFNVTVKVENVQDLFAWQVGMYYDNSIINATRWFEPLWDPEYVFYGKTTLNAYGFEPGFVLGGAVLIPGQTTFNGSGKLCIIEFEVIAVPPEGEVYSCSLNINNYDTFLLNSNGLDIPAVVENGYYELSSRLPYPIVYVIGALNVTNLPPNETVTLTFTWNTTDVVAGDYIIYAVASRVRYETEVEDNTFYNGVVSVIPRKVFVHDVAVIGCDLPFNFAYEGWVINVNVTVVNLGNATETFNVTLYYNNTVIAASSVQSLEPNTTLTLSFNWDTRGVPCCENYVIKAIASNVFGETNVDNNIYVCGLVRVKKMGDVNGDCIVDIRDLTTAILAFRTFPGRPGWNPEMDLDRNNIIDLRDFVIIILHFHR